MTYFEKDLFAIADFDRADHIDNYANQAAHKLKATEETFVNEVTAEVVKYHITTEGGIVTDLGNPGTVEARLSYLGAMAAREANDQKHPQS